MLNIIKNIIEDTKIDLPLKDRIEQHYIPTIGLLGWIIAMLVDLLT